MIAPAALPLFVYGTLLDSNFTSQLLERPVVPEPARLLDYELLKLSGLPYPVIREAPGQKLPGRIYRHLMESDYQRLDAYEGVAERLYRRRTAEIVTGDPEDPDAARERAFVYVPTRQTLQRYG